jgi:hypothetical protein
MKGIFGDIRHALRVYARTPVASALAVVVLAVAMAFVGSFLSLYIDLAFKPHPGFENSGELVTIGQNNGERIASMSAVLVERINDEIGAGPKALGRLVIGRGLALGLPGVALGGLLAFIVSAWLRDDFVSREVSPGVVTVAVAAGLMVVLLAASLGPARQARRTEPAPLLREE